MSNFNIVVDTREQKPLWKKGVIVKGLKVGDYSIDGYEDKIAIERKSAMDLFGTMGKGNKRFHAELEKARSYDYFAIVIETNYGNIYNKEFENAYRSKMKGFIVISTLFTFHMKYGVPIFMCNGRSEAKKVIKELLNFY